MDKPMGGTEILYSRLSSLMDLSGVHLLVSACGPLHPQKPNVLWQHLNTDENAVQGLKDKNYVAALDKIVFVSDWQKEKFIREFSLPAHKCVTIRNAIDPVLKHTKPAKIRLIYTSTPWRGLNKLILAYQKLDRDVELVVYSGTSIYGKGFRESAGGNFDHLYAELKALGATHIEYASNEEVKKALTEAHILAYPNTWEETSCLSAIEALAAGCKVVTTRNGALPETCGDWADYTDIDGFVVALRHAIDNYVYDEKQVDYYNTAYSWETRVKEWQALFQSLKTFEHKLSLLKDNGISIERVLDIGAYRGEFTKAIKAVWADAKITQFEADERQKDYLQPDAHIALLGDANKEVDFYTIEDIGHGRTTGSSIYRENTEHYADPIVIKKQMFKLDDLVDLSEDWSNGLVKLDTQGSELDILRGAQTFLTQCQPRFLLLECSFQPYNQGSPLIDEVVDTLKLWGYEALNNLGLMFDSENKLLQADVLFERKQKMRKVLIATPAYDGRVDAWYTFSLIESVRIAQANGIFLQPVFMSYDALIQRARNDLFKLAVENDYDDMIFIDSDLAWEPNWIMELLAIPEDVVGGTYRKKTDASEMYVVKTENLERNERTGLIKVLGLGTGFVKLSKKAIHSLWESSEEYSNANTTCRMVCDVQIIDGQLYSEDTIMFYKLDKLGFDVWLAPHMTCKHNGTKQFVGNFETYAARVKESLKNPAELMKTA